MHAITVWSGPHSFWSRVWTWMGVYGLCMDLDGDVDGWMWLVVWSMCVCEDACVYLWMCVHSLM